MFEITVFGTNRAHVYVLLEIKSIIGRNRTVFFTANSDLVRISDSLLDLADFLSSTSPLTGSSFSLSDRLVAVSCCRIDFLRALIGLPLPLVQDVLLGDYCSAETYHFQAAVR